MEYNITHRTGVPELNDKQNIKMRYGAFYCCCFFVVVVTVFQNAIKL